jgi:hypothetical protein
MGRRNKKLAKIQQAQQAREFLKHKEKAPSFKSLPKESKQLEIAHTCTLILSNPQLQYSRLDSLLELCDDPDAHIQGCAITSLCSVFIDILPGYRIMSHDSEKVTLSKETKALRIYEGDLLKFYEKFIQILQERNNRGCVKSICRLLTGLFHFNCREELLSLAIRHIQTHADEVVKAVKTVLESNDFEFRFTTIQALERFIKTSSFRTIPEELIDSLAALTFNSLAEEVPKKRKREEIDEETKDQASETRYVRSM